MAGATAAEEDEDDNDGVLAVVSIVIGCLEC